MRKILAALINPASVAILITTIGAGLIAWGVALSPLPWVAPIVIGVPLFAFGLLGIQVDDRRGRRR